MSREIRFSLLPAGVDRHQSINGWAGCPAFDGAAPYLTLRATLSGEVDARTGYLCDIKVIDDLLRQTAVPLLQERWRTEPKAGLGGIMPQLWRQVIARCPPGGRLQALLLHATPHLRFAVRRGDPDMVSMTYAFEFAASHRLYCADLSDDENRRMFGKCAHRHGHGHNYVVEITIAGEPDPTSGSVFLLTRFEQIVQTRVLEPLDHKHLNVDCAEFATLNTTVENITRVIFEKLRGRFEPARLERVRVYETPRTYAEYGE